MDESITHEQATSEDAPIGPGADQGSAGGDPNDAAQLQAALVADPVFKSVYGGSATEVGTAAFDTTDHSISKPMGVFSVKDGVPVLEQEIVKIKAGEDPNTALVQ